MYEFKSLLKIKKHKADSTASVDFYRRIKEGLSSTSL